jgi:hypothetical protein
VSWNEIELRTCQFCKRSSIVYRDGTYELVKYGIRHYAHPTCLASRRGQVVGRAMIPEHQRRSYDVAMLDADDWTIKKAELLDKAAGVTLEPDECRTCLGHGRIRDAETKALRRCLDCGGSGTFVRTNPDSVARMPKKVGRKPRGGKLAPGRFGMRVTERELRAWTKAADAAGVDVSGWLRGLANKAAGVDVPAVASSSAGDA